MRNFFTKFLEINKIFNALNVLLFCSLFIGFILRTTNSNWDQGFHLHPDERAITMFTLPLKFPSSFGEFLSPTSTLNPHFFAYGNLPIYLLKFTSIFFGFFKPSYSSYENINILGRHISAATDTLTIILVFLIGKKLFSKKIGVFSAIFYSLSVFPIQASHYYAVDILLAFFTTLTIYALLKFYSTPSVKLAIFCGICFGLALATKISALSLIATVIGTLGIDFFLVFLKQPHKPKNWLLHVPKFVKKLILEGAIIFFSAGITFVVLQPYAIIDFQEFIKQNLLQSQMSNNPFIFPYTLQYVGKIPYLYELKNIFYWGMGPLLSSLSFAGVIFFIFHLFLKEKRVTFYQEIIFMSFFSIYFFTVGRFSVGWMRYMLPLYPFFAIFAGLFLVQLVFFLKKYSRIFSHITLLLFFTGISTWTLAYQHIYAKPNTRYEATIWINRNIPYGSTLAIEHWDDSLPLFGIDKYNIETLELYNQDNKDKWEKINTQLTKADYIIIASNRLYAPLQKLTDCKHLPVDKCYPLTAQYYKDLFSEKNGFKKIKEFTSYPTIPILNMPINDQGADESFTVYDHPKVMIFKK